MSSTLAGSLVALALIDSLSFGALGVPVWMLAHARGRARSVVAYLVTLAAFYWVAGLALLFGAGWLWGVLESAGDGPVSVWLQLGLGALLLALSFVILPPGRRRRRKGDAGADGVVRRRRASVVGDDARTGAVVGLALLAGVVELATMLPYLAAIALIAGSGAATTTQLAVLAGYVAVMMAPAALLLALRSTAGHRVQHLLERLNRWFERTGKETIAWLVGIAGVLLMLDAYERLRPMG